eukprot:TRINITY_DN1576_c0_g1_i1.p1 TRINITY_DN1576_c0_g1~~TRINITY_DN1576_c0_g1_i1.p1  ORF type:complete len:444 (+),score=92.39 TRINITY_DN1576_c0_g1_i1:126-1334(+)
MAPCVGDPTRSSPVALAEGRAEAAAAAWGGSLGAAAGLGAGNYCFGSPCGGDSPPALLDEEPPCGSPAPEPPGPKVLVDPLPPQKPSATSTKAQVAEWLRAALPSAEAGRYAAAVLAEDLDGEVIHILQGSEGGAAEFLEAIGCSRARDREWVTAELFSNAFCDAHAYDPPPAVIHPVTPVPAVIHPVTSLPAATLPDPPLPAAFLPHGAPPATTQPALPIPAAFQPHWAPPASIPPALQLPELQLRQLAALASSELMPPAPLRPAQAPAVIEPIHPAAARPLEPPPGESVQPAQPAQLTQPPPDGPVSTAAAPEPPAPGWHPQPWAVGRLDPALGPAQGADAECGALQPPVAPPMPHCAKVVPIQHRARPLNKRLSAPRAKPASGVRRLSAEDCVIIPAGL